MTESSNYKVNTANLNRLISRLEALKATPIFLHVPDGNHQDIAMLCEEASEILDALNQQCREQVTGITYRARQAPECACQYAGYAVGEARRSLDRGDIIVAAAQLADAVPSLRNAWDMLIQGHNSESDSHMAGR
jgi:hypothetical protein